MGSISEPTIPAKAGIHEASIWIPAFAGMVGLLRSGDNRKSPVILNSPWPKYAPPIGVRRYAGSSAC